MSSDFNFTQHVTQHHLGKACSWVREHAQCFLLNSFCINLQADSNIEIEKEFSSDQDGEDKQYNAIGKSSWGQIQGQNQSHQTTKFPICLSRKSANKKAKESETFDRNLVNDCI